MSELYHSEEAPQNIYWDRRYYTTFEEQEEALKGSSTLYVGNLNFRTTEQQMEETFSRVGPVKRIIMGLNRETKGHCGFGFVEYYTHEHAVACLKYISGTNCDENIIRCELDAGFKPGRQYGRGQSGGQVRDERRGGISNLKYGVSAGQRKQKDSRKGGISSRLGDKSGNSSNKGGEKKVKRDTMSLLDEGLSSSRGGKSAPAELSAVVGTTNIADDDDDDLLAELDTQATKKKKT